LAIYISFSSSVANYATAPTNNNRRHSQDSTATTACSSEPAKRVHKNVEHVLNWCKCGAMVLLIATLVFCLLAKVYASVMSK
jgi:hypothetical protein